MRDSYEANFVNFAKLLSKDLHSEFPFIPLQLHYKVDETSKSTKKYRKNMCKVNEAIRNACQQLAPSARMAEISPEMEKLWSSMCHADGHSGTEVLVLEGRHLADI